MARRLTEKQEIFAQGLAEGLTQREAYSRAYDVSKMKESTIDQCASRLAKDRKITARCIDIRSERLSKRDQLTPKQERFLWNLIYGMNRRQAYKEAYDAEGMKDSVIDAKAYEIIHNGKFTVRYQQILSEISEGKKEEAAERRNRVMDELYAIATDDISNHVEFGVKGGDACVEIKDSVLTDTRALKEISQGKNGVKIKMYDKIAAARELLKIMEEETVDNQVEIVYKKQES